MKSGITIDSLGVDVSVEHPRRKGPAQTEVIHLQVHRSAFWVWDNGCQLCSDIYNFDESLDGQLGRPLSEMPHLDASFRSLTEHYVFHRGTLIAAHLEPAVRAMETAIAARDGSSVYFADAGGQIKIGWSCKVSARIAQLQTGSAAPIRLIGTTPGGLALERRLHKQFHHLRLSGEWFLAAPELLDHIAEVSR